VRDSIEAYIDRGAWRRLQAIEREERQSLAIVAVHTRVQAQ
jgi:hypothetical protein